MTKLARRSDRLIRSLRALAATTALVAGLGAFSGHPALAGQDEPRFSAPHTMSGADQVVAGSGPVCGPAVLERTVRLFVEALGRDRAEAAFSLMAPDLKAHFTSAEAFLALVARFQRPVYRHRSIIFDGVDLSHADPVVRFYFRTEKNRQWLALFVMRQHAQGGWKVSNFAIALAPGRII